METSRKLSNGVISQFPTLKEYHRTTGDMPMMGAVPNHGNGWFLMPTDDEKITPFFQELSRASTIQAQIDFPEEIEEQMNSIKEQIDVVIDGVDKASKLENKDLEHHVSGILRSVGEAIIEIANNPEVIKTYIVAVKKYLPLYKAVCNAVKPIIDGYTQMMIAVNENILPYQDAVEECTKVAEPVVIGAFQKTKKKIASFIAYIVA